MELSLFTGFILVSLTLACTPGADWAYIISSAIAKRSFVPAVLGLLSGYLFHTALVACGIAALVASSPWLLSWLTAIGALYLFWLGISTLRSWKSASFHRFQPNDDTHSSTPNHTDSRPHSSSAPNLSSTATLEAVDQRPVSAGFLKGLLTSATNPKALLLYVALIPQFISPAALWPMPVQTAALGMTHFVVSIVIYFAVALTARILLRSRPLAARLVTMLSGLIMIGLSITLIIEQVLLA